MSRRKFSTKQLVLCALFIALISVGSYIKVYFGVIPFSLQFMFVMLTGQILGAFMGTVTLIVYTLIGIIGIPVFAGGGGLTYVLQPSFGYIIGFIFATLIIGLISHTGKCSFLRFLIANIAGFAAVYFFGISYYFLLNTFYFGKTVDLVKMFVYCFAVFLPSDLTFVVLTALVSKKLRPIVDKLM